MTEFVIADLHFGEEGARRRRRIPGVADIDAELIRRWNAVVTDTDTVFVLGDVGRRGGFSLARHLRGTKHLIAGNGDDLSGIGRTNIFTSMSVIRWLPGMTLTHVPIHPTQLRRGNINVHGHLHAGAVGDPRYVCVSVEQTNFAPVAVHEIHEWSARQMNLHEHGRERGGAGQGMFC